MEDNSMMVFPLSSDWFPQTDPEPMNWPLLFVPAWRNEADLVEGDMPLDANCLRGLAEICIQCAEYLEGRENAED